MTTDHAHHFVEDSDVVAYGVPYGWRPPEPWQPQTNSPLEILRPAWDLWQLGYRLTAIWFAGCSLYCTQKADMLQLVQTRYDSGWDPRWWV